MAKEEKYNMEDMKPHKWLPRWGLFSVETGASVDYKMITDIHVFSPLPFGFDVFFFFW